MYVRQQGANKHNILATSMALFILFTFNGLSSATATSIAVADIEAQLTYSSPSNELEFTFFDAFAIFDQVENGDASATGFATEPQNLGNGIRAGATAAATASPVGSSLGFGAAFGSFELTNTTQDSIDIDFTLVYEWTLLGSAEDSSFEHALANIALAVFINDVSFSLINEGNITPPDFTKGSENMSSGILVSQVYSNVSIPSGTTFIDLGVAAQAEASSAAIPEPATILLLGSGLAGLALHQRRQRQSFETLKDKAS